jgi:hypothetical protein
MPSSGALSGDDLGKVIVERGDDPRLDAVHSIPVRRRWSQGFRANVIMNRELAEDEQELITPAVKVTGVDVKDGGDVVPNVVDSDDVGMKLQKSNSFMMKHGGAEIVNRRWCTSRCRTGGFTCNCGSSGHTLLGGTRQGLAGTLGGGVTILSSSCLLLLSVQGMCQGSITHILVFALETLSGGDSFVCLLLGEVLDSGRGVSFLALGVGRGFGAIGRNTTKRTGAQGCGQRKKKNKIK